MKKNLLLKVTAVVLLCFSSLLIKSENAVRTIHLACVSGCCEEKTIPLNETNNNFFHYEDGFIIKI